MGNWWKRCDPWPTSRIHSCWGRECLKSPCNTPCFGQVSCHVWSSATKSVKSLNFGRIKCSTAMCCAFEGTSDIQKSQVLLQLAGFQTRVQWKWVKVLLRTIIYQYILYIYRNIYKYHIVSSLFRTGCGRPYSDPKNWGTKGPLNWKTAVSRKRRPGNSTKFANL